MRILLVEDDELLGDAVRRGLLQEGHSVEWIKDGLSAEQAILSELFDMVILDLGLPRKGGLSILREVRNSGCDTKILILTARDSVEEKVRGLDYGADDYLAKPFDLEELHARLRALQRRRAGGKIEAVMKTGKIVLDPAAHTVSVEDKLVNVSPKEYALLFKLLENAGRVLSREQLEQYLYGWDLPVDSNAVEVHVHNLRKKLNTDVIRTVRGVGYIIDKEDVE